MAPQPNRVGGVRGPDGTTLDDLLAAIQDLTAAISTSVSNQAIVEQLQLLNTAIGVPDDCSASHNVIELLCILAGGIVGFEDIPEQPASICSGYELSTTVGPKGFTQATTNGSPSPPHFLSLAEFGPSFPFESMSLPWISGYTASEITICRLSSGSASLNMCLTLEHDGSTQAITMVIFNAVTGNIASYNSLTGGGVAGVTNVEFTFQQGVWYILNQTMAGGGNSASRVWLSSGALG